MNVLLFSIGDSPVKGRYVSNHPESFIRWEMGGHEILTFGYNPGVDIRIGVDEPFENVIRGLPAGWVPDCCLLWGVEWTLLPKGIEEAPCPTLALISDWDYDVPLSRRCLESVDAVVSHAETEREPLLALGARKAFVYEYVGVLEEFLQTPPKPVRERKHDIVYTTHLDDVQHPERSQWVMRLCSLAVRYNVLIETHLPGYRDYMRLIEDAKLVFSTHRFGSMSGRVLEASGRGAVALETGVEAHRHLAPEIEFVPVTEEGLAAEVERVLGDPERLQAMSDAAHRKVLDTYGARQRFIGLLSFIEAALAERPSRERKSLTWESGEAARRGETLFYAFFRTRGTGHIGGDGSVLLRLCVEELRRAAEREPTPRSMTNMAVALLAMGLSEHPEERAEAAVLEPARILEEVAASSPGYVTAHVHLGVLWFRIGRFEQALKSLARAGRLLEDGSGDLDIWALQSRDFRLFNEFLRRPLNLELIRWCRGEEQVAEAAIRRLHQGYVQFLISMVEERRGRAGEAAEAAARSCAFAPESGVAAARAAALLARMGRREESLALYRRAVTLCPMIMGVRLEFIRYLYYCGLTKDLSREIDTAFILCQAIGSLRSKLDELRHLVDTFTLRREDSVYSYDIARESVVRDWLKSLHSDIQKDPENIPVLQRIADLWAELGRWEKVAQIVEDYRAWGTKAGFRDPGTLECVDRVEKRLGSGKRSTAREIERSRRRIEKYLSSAGPHAMREMG